MLIIGCKEPLFQCKYGSLNWTCHRATTKTDEPEMRNQCRPLTNTPCRKRRKTGACSANGAAHEQTRGLFIDDRDDGYRASGVTGDWAMPAKAIDGFGFFEFYRSDTRTYHRVPVPDIITAIDDGNSSRTRRP